MKHFLTQAEFIALSVAQRNKLREVFNIGKSGQVRVQSTPGGDRLVSDGTETQDLMNSLNIKGILKFLGREFKDETDYNFDALYGEAMVKFFPSEPIKELAPKEEPKVPVPETEKEELGSVENKIIVSQKKRGRSKKLNNLG